MKYLKYFENNNTEELFDKLYGNLVERMVV